MQCLKTEYLTILKILSTAVIALLLVGCGSDITESGGSEPDPEYMNVRYTAWSTHGYTIELNVSYYVCDQSFNRDTTFTGTFWSFDFQAQSGDSLLIGCRATEGGISTSVSVWVSDVKVTQEEGLNPVARYIIP